MSERLIYKKGSNRRRGPWKKFTLDEANDMLAYICRNERYSEVKGKKLYKDMEKEKVTQRTWSAMNEHFRRQIAPNLHQKLYDITDEEMLELMTHCGRYSPATVKKLKRSREDSVDDNSNIESEPESDGDHMPTLEPSINEMTPSIGCASVSSSPILVENVSSARTERRQIKENLTRAPPIQNTLPSMFRRERSAERSEDNTKNILQSPYSISREIFCSITNKKTIAVYSNDNLCVFKTKNFHSDDTLGTTINLEDFKRLFIFTSMKDLLTTEFINYKNDLKQHESDVTNELNITSMQQQLHTVVEHFAEKRKSNILSMYLNTYKDELNMDSNSETDATSACSGNSPVGKMEEEIAIDITEDEEISTNKDKEDTSAGKVINPFHGTSPSLLTNLSKNIVSPLKNNDRCKTTATEERNKQNEERNEPEIETIIVDSDSGSSSSSDSDPSFVIDSDPSSVSDSNPSSVSDSNPSSVSDSNSTIVCDSNNKNTNQKPAANILPSVKNVTAVNLKRKKSKPSSKDIIVVERRRDVDGEMNLVPMCVLNRHNQLHISSNVIPSECTSGRNPRQKIKTEPETDTEQPSTSRGFASVASVSYDNGSRLEELLHVIESMLDSDSE